MSSVILTALYPCYIRSILCIIVLFSVSLLLFYSLYPCYSILCILVILSFVSLKLYSLNPSYSILFNLEMFFSLNPFILSSVSLKNLNENLFGYILEIQNIFFLSIALQLLELCSKTYQILILRAIFFSLT